MGAAILNEEVAASRWPVLRPVAPELGGRPIALNRPVCVVGARSVVHLRLSSAEVSRYHALIVNDEDGVYIRDLASRNHVYVNGTTVREVGLSQADLLRIGPYTFSCYAGFKNSDSARKNGSNREQAAPRNGAGAAAHLQVGATGEAIPIQGRTLLIGRRSDCDIVLKEEGVDPVHAVVFELKGKRFVRDLNSSGGTQVADERIHERELRPGDTIRIGETEILYGAPVAKSEPELVPVDVELPEPAEDLQPVSESIAIETRPQSVGEGSEAQAPADHAAAEIDEKVPEPESAIGNEQPPGGEVLAPEGEPFAPEPMAAMTEETAKHEQPVEAHAPPVTETPAVSRTDNTGDDEEATNIPDASDLGVSYEYAIFAPEAPDQDAPYTVDAALLSGRRDPEGEPEVPGNAEPSAATERQPAAAKELAEIEIPPFPAGSDPATVSEKPESPKRLRLQAPLNLELLESAPAAGSIYDSEIVRDYEIIAPRPAWEEEAPAAKPKREPGSKRHNPEPSPPTAPGTAVEIVVKQRRERRRVTRLIGEISRKAFDLKSVWRGLHGRPR